MWAFLDGEFVEEKGNNIKLENRGLTFADGLFEVIRTIKGKILFFEDHFGRMEKSAAFFDIPLRFCAEYAKTAAADLIERNGIEDGELYLELTRGTDLHREHRYPPAGTGSTFFMLALPLRHIDSRNWVTGVKLFTYPDLRHKLCEHKTVNLLPNVLAKNYAYAHGGYEALMFREERGIKYATEGGSSNYFLVRDGVFHTPEIDNILPGITRSKIISIIRDHGYELHERRVGVGEFLEADEVILVSTVSRVMPVLSIDERQFDAPGEITLEIQVAYEKIFFSSI